MPGGQFAWNGQGTPTNNPFGASLPSGWQAQNALQPGATYLWGPNGITTGFGPGAGGGMGSPLGGMGGGQGASVAASRRIRAGHREACRRSRTFRTRRGGAFPTCFSGSLRLGSPGSYGFSPSMAGCFTTADSSTTTWKDGGTRITAP